MAKLVTGRLDGVNGMKSFSADELFAFAERLDQQAADPDAADDPRWLRRWATKVRRLAQQKDAAVQHKQVSRRR